MEWNTPRSVGYRIFTTSIELFYSGQPVVLYCPLAFISLMASSGEYGGKDA